MSSLRPQEGDSEKIELSIKNTECGFFYKAGIINDKFGSLQQRWQRG
jgi:hypothetical protein